MTADPGTDLVNAFGSIIPPPVEVNVEAASTSLIVLDVTDPICSGRPSCVATIPLIADLVRRARSTGVSVAYTTGPTEPTTVLTDVAPRPGEPIFAGRADKFHATALEDQLRSGGIRTLVLVGTSAHGAILYTSFAACARGFAVVVVADALSADTPLGVHVGLWQVLNQPGLGNPTNEPPAQSRVTVSRSDLITFAV